MAGIIFDLESRLAFDVFAELLVLFHRAHIKEGFDQRLFALQ